MSQKKNINRRQFLRKIAGTTVGAIGFPYLIPSSALGKAGSIAPSNRIVIGCIGVGWMGSTNMENFLKEPDAQVVAVCDIDKEHLHDAKNIVDKKYGNQDCATYHDFRELLARDDIDAVSIGVPDHWHAIPSIAAAKAGKDIYGEKPLSHCLTEGRAMCDAVKRYNRVWQTGSWQRSETNFRFACELVLNGRIGNVHAVEVGLPSGHTDFAGTKGQEGITPPPAELDYDFWLGPAPYAPARVHKNWRWNYDYGGGQLMDWVGHHVDIAHWGIGLDYSGPVEIECYGESPGTGLWNTATKYRATATYANGIKMIVAGGHDDICNGRKGTKWIAEEGWVWVDRSGIDAQPKSLLHETFGSNEIHLYHSPGHWRNFLDCIKTRSTTLAPCEVAHRSASVGHIALIAMKTGRKLKWDPESESFTNDSDAARFLSRSMRSPWHV